MEETERKVKKDNLFFHSKFAKNRKIENKKKIEKKRKFGKKLEKKNENKWVK